MSMSSDELYNLLPQIYRRRDAEFGWPLRGLLGVIAEQASIVESDIEQLYRNWFIETCEDWVVPYIGDLIGCQPVAGPEQRRLADLSRMSRREVANTIAYRRCKGTLALLETLCHDITGWPAHAVEAYQLLSHTQAMRHADTRRGRSVDMRNGDALDRLGGPFDRLAHMADVRRPNAEYTPGRYGPASVGLFVWRLKPYRVGRSPAFCDDRSRQHYTFDVLGHSVPLFTRPVAEPDATHIAGELSVPAPIRRRAFAARTADYYGIGKSLCIWLGPPTPEHLVPVDRIVAADLSSWGYRPQGEQVAVDPELGRFVLAARPAHGVWVTYHYGFAADLGGGDYARPQLPSKWAGPAQKANQSPPPRLYRVGAAGEFRTFNQALCQWYGQKPAAAVIEFTDSDAYVEQINIVDSITGQRRDTIELEAGQRLELRAAPGARPVIRLLDYYTNRPDALRVAGKAQPAAFVVDGLYIAGRGIQVSGSVREIVIRHSTLVPGWVGGERAQPDEASEPSIELIGACDQLRIGHSIVGSVLISRDEVLADPIEIAIRDSILDAGEGGEALAAPDGGIAHAALTLLRCTVLGDIDVHAIDLAENSIIAGRTEVRNHQQGHVRFCYVAPGSRTPARYACQPDLAERAIGEAGLPAAQFEAAIRAEHNRLRPRFTSRRFGSPGYCQLAAGCAGEIASGADDESELGVFHDLYQPQRAAALRARLAAYTPAGFEAGMVFVN